MSEHPSLIGDDPADAPPASGSPYELEEWIEPLDEPAPPEALAPGTVINAPDGASWRVVEVLQNEAAGNLYEVAADDDQRFWMREARGEAAARLEHEAEVLAGLDSPLFPRVLACFTQDGATYLVSEPLPGETLSDLLATAPASLSQVLPVLAQVSFALSRLHAHGWAHLGLRPSAIALGKPAKVLDLSYATRLGEKAAPFYHAGYSPPELLEGEAVDARADVYAVGALLFHALDGAPLPETGAQLSTWKPAVPVPGAPQILHRCLGERNSRYATMDELHQALLRLIRRLAPVTTISVAGASTIGLEAGRSVNQDAFGFLSGHLATEDGDAAWAVACLADGMGGMEAGELAAKAAVEAVLSEATVLTSPSTAPVFTSGDEQTALVTSWAHAANDSAVAVLEARGARGGCTFISAAILGRRLVIAHVGDCRLYLLRGEHIRLLTRDHSVVMALVLQGQLEMSEVRSHPDRSKVTRSLGERQPLPEYYVDTLEDMTGTATMELESGDIILGCSDGVWEPVQDDEILNIVRDQAPDMNAAAHALLHLVLERGAPDNATVILMRVDEK